MTDDPQTEEELRAALSRAYLDAIRWNLWAQRLFWIGALMTITGSLVILAGAMNFFGDCKA